MNLKNMFIAILIFITTICVVNYKSVSATGVQMTIAGTIRNTGKGWSVINDKVHSPLNIVGVKTYKDKIMISHTPTAKIIHTFEVTPDETLSKKGYRVGISGGTTYSYIYIYDKNNNLVNPNTVTDVSSNIWIYGLVSK